MKFILILNLLLICVCVSKHWSIIYVCVRPMILFHKQSKRRKNLSPSYILLHFVAQTVCFPRFFRFVLLQELLIVSKERRKKLSIAEHTYDTHRSKTFLHFSISLACYSKLRWLWVKSKHGTHSEWNIKIRDIEKEFKFYTGMLHLYIVCLCYYFFIIPR